MARLGTSEQLGDMTLDFFTLYIVIILISFALSVVWGAIAWQYRSFLAARIWFVACLLTGTGGIILPFQHLIDTAIVPAVLGNGIVVLGFWLLWIGARRFYNMPGGWGLALGATAISTLITISVFNNDELLACALAIGQSVPMFVSLTFLLSRSRRSSGALLSSGGIVVGLTGHATVIALNGILMAGISLPATGLIASFTMLGVIFSGVLWHFGFAVMTLEQLRNEVAELARIDPLTGVGNRRKFDEQLVLENSFSRRTGRPYALLVFDLDNFKSINDQLGHAGGDAALIHVVRIAATSLRETDLLARLGGDEFCIVMSDSSMDDGYALAQRFAELLRKSPLLSGGNSIRLTASIGISAWSSETADTDDAVLTRADHALYAAKTAGRDAIRCAPAPATRHRRSKGRANL
ncbi:sensor domain-containing diguanylate cyclase [Pelagibacterium lentulum]|uniref:diguanylate cyclase n=1 Tax=Pelagibacterium lentulum TaxID=2029865 RepID=A0A916RHQ3_9HYPH|nr:sensor domain-containing diguanylate cyclase [Pelagibacterium lentulum]GGA56461.1 GGDEF domain-containing protein [Pelagibacterium lentulum]